MAEKKKKILHLLASNKFSGAENVACTIIRNMSDDFDMVYCSPRGPIEKKLKEMGIRYIGIDKLNRKNLKRVVDKYKPDIIHAHDYRASLVASGFNKRCKIISHIHLDNPKVRVLGFWSILYKVLALRFEKIIWVSEDAFRNYFYNDDRNIINKSVILRNIVDVNYIKEKAKKDGYNGSFDLIFIGRLSDQKNPERAIEIMRLIREYKDNIKLAIVGDGDKREKVKNSLSKYGLQENVMMFGFQENPYPILSKSRILLMTSDFEGTPMVILEAQALGKPVVSTKLEGFEKLIFNDRNGFLSDDSSEMAQKIVEFLQEETYVKLSENTLNFFKRNNDDVGYFKALIGVYGK